MADGWGNFEGNDRILKFFLREMDQGDSGRRSFWKLDTEGCGGRMMARFREVMIPMRAPLWEKT